MSSKSKNTMMTKAEKEIDKQKQKRRAGEAAALNRHATMRDLKQVKDELRQTHERMAEQGTILALMKFVLRTKLGITDEELAANMRAMRRSDALERLNKLKAMGVSNAIIKQQCQQMGFEPKDFPVVFNQAETANE